jgi:hypothetical protein
MVGSIHIGSSIFPTLTSLIATLLVWPAVVVSFIMIAAGLVGKRPALLAAGALLGVPFFAYLALTPRFFVVGFIPVVLHLIAAVALAKGRPKVAAVLCLPGILLAGFMLAAVLGQDR